MAVIFTLVLRFKKKKKSFFLNRLKQKHHPLLFRRLAFLWIFLIIVEIGCPIFECQSFAAELPIDNSKIISTIVLNDFSESSNTFSEVKLKSQDNSTTADDYSIADHQSLNEDCNDECLCHTTPINILAFIIPKYFQHSLVTSIKLKFQPSSDLPPPYQPPQFS